MLTPDGCMDGRTDERMERRKLYTPRHTLYAGGIMKELFLLEQVLS